MKKTNMFRILNIVLGGLLMLSACSDSDECISGQLDVLTLEDLYCDMSAYQLHINSSKEFELIRDQEQYDHLINSPCNPTIDWDTYDIIAGNILLDYGLESLTNRAYFDCQANTLAITVTVHINEVTTALPIAFAFLIPKLDGAESPYINIVTLQ